MQPIRISQLTFLAFTFNGALGSGRYDDVSVEEVKRRIGDGSVFGFLSSRLGGDLDLSILSEGQEEVLRKEWEELVVAYDEHRKFAVERNGLCLLVAYLLEGVQRRVAQLAS